MHERRPHVRTALSAILAAVLLHVTPVALPCSAAGLAPSDVVVDKVRKAQDIFNEARGQENSDAKAAARGYEAAATMYAQTATEMENTEANRPARGELLGKAVSAYLASHRISLDIQPLESARVLIRTHIVGLEETYGIAAPNVPEYRHAEEQASRVQSLLDALAAPVMAPNPPPEPSPEPPPELPPESPEPARHEADWRRIGLGVSGGLAGAALATAVGTSLAFVREPFRGAAYKRIEDAAIDAGVPHSKEDDMCGLGRAMMVDAVIAACDDRDRIRSTAIGMMVVGGAFLTSTVVFAVLHARSRRSGAQAHLRRHPVLVIAPTRGGAHISAFARF